MTLPKGIGVMPHIQRAEEAEARVRELEAALRRVDDCLEAGSGSPNIVLAREIILAAAVPDRNEGARAAGAEGDTPT